MRVESARENIDSAWVNGKQIVSNGKINTIAVDELCQQLI